MFLFNRKIILTQPPVSINDSNVFVLPTIFCIYLAGLLGLMVVGSLNYQNNFALIFILLVISIMFWSIIYTQKNLSGLKIIAFNVPKRAESESGEIKINFISNKNQYALVFELEKSLCGVNVKKNEISSASLILPPRKRGVYPIPRIKIKSQFPFGLSEVWSYMVFNDKEYVHPKIIHDLNLPYNLTKNSLTKNHKKTLNYFGDIKSLKNYKIGEPKKMISWKASAKQNKLLTKELEITKNDEIELNYEMVKNIEFEKALSYLASWALIANKQQIKTKFVFNDFILNYNCGEKHISKILNFLSEVNNK